MVKQTLIPRCLKGILHSCNSISPINIQRDFIGMCNYELLKNLSKLANQYLNTISSRRPLCTAASARIPHKENSNKTLYGGKDWKWLRPADIIEAEMFTWNRHKTRMGMPFLTFSSRVPISEDTFRQMLIHLRNMCPILRLCIVPRSDQLWLAEVKDMDLDFKMECEKNINEVVDNMANTGFDNSTWIVRVVPEKGEYHCAVPEVQNTLPYHYHILQLIPHSFADGAGLVLVSRKMCDILEDMLAGKPINDKVQIGELRKCDELIRKKALIKKYLVDNPEILEKEQEKLIQTIKNPILNEAFSPPNVDFVTTNNLIRSIDTSILSSFHAKCKSAGVTVSSGLLAAVNTSIVEIVRDAGIVQDFYPISFSQNVDLRRYMKVNPQMAMGMLVSGMQQASFPTGNVRKEFWEHATSLNIDSRYLLKNDSPLMQSIIRGMTLPPLDPNEICKSNSKHNYERDYSFSNMLDVTRLFYNKGNFIQITDCQSYQFQQYYNQMMFSISTYRNVSTLTLSYVTNVLNKDIAHEIMERILLIIRDKS
ncbi:unnamed protein product [Meganyctiphanes norvegica]|uniref:Condensation domain-containing protein n=1 Tax=Meganyctiphanes norvegica TaxID=48144 RepID=A0AAV2QUF1_MEGNR